MKSYHTKQNKSKNFILNSNVPHIQISISIQGTTIAKKFTITPKHDNKNNNMPYPALYQTNRDCGFCIY